MSRKRILYIGNKLSKHGNTATSIETLGEFLEKEGYVLYYASSRKNKAIRLFDMVFSTFRWGRRVDYVLIDTYSTVNFWYAVIISQLCRLLHVKYINKLHGGNLPDRIKNNPFICDMVFKNAYAITAPSGYLMDSFSKRNYPNLIFLPNTIDISKYPYLERRVTSPKLLWVRSFSPIYNPNMAVKVFYELKKDYPDTALCMVGPDKENALQGCMDLAKELKVEVVFTGKLAKEDWINLSKEYTVFINTTHFDNTPVSLLEAMAIGIPVVSTNVGGIPFLATNNETALLVNDNAVAEMVGAIKKLANNEELALHLIRNSRKLAEGCDWQIIKNYWFDLLK